MTNKQALQTQADKLQAELDTLKSTIRNMDHDYKIVTGGYHPVTGKLIMCADRDLPKQMTYNDTVKYIAKNMPGWRLPTMAELQSMYHNRETIGGFKTKIGSDFARWYWSSTEHRDVASFVYNVRFTDGDGSWNAVDTCALSTRPVRAEL